jgi:hypothetical protein
VLAAVPVRAARALPDSGKWNNYFALFARDTAVPWKRISLRLDTYSGAPVEFAAYDVDPADVLVAGANAKPRPFDTSRATAVAKWRFSPPAGLGFASNDVEVPLRDHEGFFVIEARRGDAVQQVWLNLTRVALVTKEAPGGALVYGSDLSNGRALGGMRVTYLVGVQFAYDKTDAQGVSHVPARARFALAEWGKSKAFVSFLPQSPPPEAVVGVRAERAAVRAGDKVRVIGFARRRNGEEYRPATGNATVTLVNSGKTLATAVATLDPAGAFNAELAVPADLPGGNVAILATAAGASGGATIHVDALGDVSLAVFASCTSACPPDAEIPVTVSATRAGRPAAGEQVRLRIVRTPHVLAPDTPADTPQWGTTRLYDGTVTTDVAGRARVTIPAPSDGLASTYGIDAGSGSATATARLVAPTAKLALMILPDSTSLNVGRPVGLEVRGFDATDGSPASGANVHVTIAHGPTQQETNVTLGALGTARVLFRDVALGMNLATAVAEVDGKRAMDVAAVTIAPVSIDARAEARARSGEVRIAFDGPRQKPGSRVTVNATLRGAIGDALVTMESARGVSATVVPVRDGTASAALVVPETLGAIAVGVAFVRDGAVVDGSAPLVVDGPGHERAIALAPDKPSYAPGATAVVTVNDGDDRRPATLAIRLTDRRAAEGASFESIAGILAASGTTTQNTAAEDPPWHAFVAPARSTASDIVGLEAPPVASVPDEPIALETARVLVWRIEQLDGATFSVVLPRERGRYVLSIVKLTSDGDVGTASIPVTVQ